MKHDKDMQLLEHIIRYCDEVEMALSEYGRSKERFMSNAVFRNACSMPLSQIGELAKHLSDKALAEMPGIPWRNVKGMRDFFVHEYHHMNAETIWEAATEDAPELRRVCIGYFEKLKRE